MMTHGNVTLPPRASTPFWAGLIGVTWPWKGPALVTRSTFDTSRYVDPRVPGRPLRGRFAQQDSTLMNSLYQYANPLQSRDYVRPRLT